MADTKISGLAAETSPVDADLLVMVDDVAGTPVTEKITFADAAAGAPFKSRYRVVSDKGTVTDHTPNNLTIEQWGTEELTFAQADVPASAVVVATLDGRISPNLGGSPVAGDRGAARLDISFDGGGSFASMGNEVLVTMFLVASSANDHPFSKTFRATGTVTGDIQVRAMCRDGTQANDCIFEGGEITAIVHPQ